MFYSFKEKELYEKALSKWGSLSQIDMAVEEMAELIVKLRHYFRNKCEHDDVIDEIADASVMICQLAVMFGVQDVQDQIDKKLERLESLLAE